MEGIRYCYCNQYSHHRLSTLHADSKIPYYQRLADHNS